MARSKKVNLFLAGAGIAVTGAGVELTGKWNDTTTSFTSFTS